MASKRWADVADAEAFFAGEELGTAVFHQLADLIADLGGAELRVAATQVGWARRRGFTSLWCPKRVLGPRGAELVLTVYLTAPDPSPRWKQTVEVGSGLWAHHLEVVGPEDIDDEVSGWVSAAYRAAAPD